MRKFIIIWVDLYVTGSNAYFLSGDLATLLSGRYITIHILPFSFAEFSESQKDASLNKYELFNNYLYETSLPQGVFLRNQGADIQNMYIQDVYNTIVEKDIRQRYNIQNMRSFNNLSIFLMCNRSVASLEQYFKAMKQDRQISPQHSKKIYRIFGNSYVFIINDLTSKENSNLQHK